MGFLRNFSAVEWIILVVVLLLAFGSAKLPDIARSLGRSARVMRSELDELKDEARDAKNARTAPGPLPRATDPTAPSDRPDDGTPTDHPANT